MIIARIYLIWWLGINNSHAYNGVSAIISTEFKCTRSLTLTLIKSTTFLMLLTSYWTGIRTGIIKGHVTFSCPSSGISFLTRLFIYLFIFFTGLNLAKLCSEGSEDCTVIIFWLKWKVYICKCLKQGQNLFSTSTICLRNSCWKRMTFMRKTSVSTGTSLNFKNHFVYLAGTCRLDLCDFTASKFH